MSLPMEVASSSHSASHHPQMGGPPATPSHPSLLPALSPSISMEQTPAPLHTLPPHLQQGLSRPGSAQSQHIAHGHHGPPIPQPQFIAPNRQTMHTPGTATSMQPPSSTTPQGGNSNVFGSVMGSAPGQVPQPETNSKVYASVYSGIPVYEAMIRGISVMRRCADSWVNATQILKVAGIPKSSRTKILEREVLTGTHEKVQGGYGKYQGTWIPHARGMELAAQYGVTNYLAPIFDLSASPSSVAALPVARDERQGLKTPGNGVMAYGQGPSRPSPYAQHPPPPQYAATEGGMWQPVYDGNVYYPAYNPDMAKMGAPSMTPGRPSGGSMSGLAPAPNISGMGLPPSHADVYLDQYGQPHSTFQYTNGDDHPPPAKRQRSDDGEADLGDFLPEGEEEQSPTQKDMGEEIVEEEEDSDDESTVAPPLPNAFRLATKPLRPKANATAGKTRSKLLAAFSTDEAVDLRASLGLSSDEETDVDIDTIIDDQGHTALHWATSLAKPKIATQLIELGADINRGNYAGETPLIRAVLTTNYAESGNFSTLLSAVSASIQTLDHAHRSVVHHIALIAGVHGRAASARTYMATVLDWVAKEGAEAGLPLKTLVNVQDVHGDTALNIAARVGSKALIGLLLDAGADKARANKLGLKPVDFGVEVEALQVSAGETIVSSLKAEIPKPERKSRDVQKNISAIFETINETFAAEMTQKQTKLNATETAVRHATRALSDKRQQVARAQAIVGELEQVKQKIENVRKALGTLSSQDWSGRSTLATESKGETTIPTAFRPVQLSSPIRPTPGEDVTLPERGSENALKRMRRIDKWEDRMSVVLQDRLSSLEGESADKAVKYRRLVSLCTKVPQEKVDGVLDALTQAIESDGSSIDQGRVSGLMARLKEPQAAR